MNNEFMDDLGDMVFTIGVVAALGLATANLAVQITHERALLADSGPLRTVIPTQSGQLFR